MHTDPFGPELTAFALNDPSLADTQKQAIEARLAAEPAARQFVEDTRSLGVLLTENLTMNAEPKTDSPMGHTVASTMEPKRKRGMLPWWATALAVCVAFAVGAMLMEQKSSYVMKEAARPARVARTDEESNRQKDSDFKGAMGLGKIDDEEKLAAGTKSVPEHGSFSYKLQQQGASTPAWAQGNGNFNGGFGGQPQANVGPIATGAGPVAPGQPWTEAPKPAPAPVPATVSATPPQSGTGTLTLSGSSSTGTMMNGGTLTLIAPGESKPADPGVPGFNWNSTSHSRGNAYPQLIENPFTEVKGEAALSTFGVDVDTASYSLVRNYLNHNTLPPKDAVRLEEMVNYFPYKDAPPEGNDPYAVRVEMAECPWQPKHKLARIALKAKPIDNTKRPKSNLVFLIDVSGSMDGPNRLPLVKAAMKLLVGQLGENDRVALVVYAGASGLVLDSTNCGNKDTILKALDDLKPGGSTNGASGIQLAYDIAVNNFVKDGTNRVILCTDGDWNVGTTSTDALIKLIEEKRKTGVFLSVFGFGMGNLRDEMMVQLAGKGNGNYAYIDTIAEAKKALVEQVSGTLVTVAKDVKIQIEFNPARVASYRLLGYEKRILAAKDFHDDKKDAGEMGAGHVVTALYELVPTGIVAEPKVDGLRYQPKVEAPKAVAEDKTSKEAFVLKLRHKMPDKDESVLREIPVPDEAKAKDKASDDFQFASAVAAFALMLKDSPYKGGANFGLVEELVGASLTNDPGAYRAEFLQLVKKAKALSGK